MPTPASRAIARIDGSASADAKARVAAASSMSRLRAASARGTRASASVKTDHAPFVCYAGSYKRSIVRFSLLLFPKETRVHVFVTGGSGLTGPAIVAELVAAGHTVLGLARSDDAADRLQALGAQPLRGSLEDLDSLREGARGADGVIHMAFGGSFADPEDL